MVGNQRWRARNSHIWKSRPFAPDSLHSLWRLIGSAPVWPPLVSTVRNYGKNTQQNLIMKAILERIMQTSPVQGCCEAPVCLLNFLDTHETCFLTPSRDFVWFRSLPAMRSSTVAALLALALVGMRLRQKKLWFEWAPPLHHFRSCYHVYLTFLTLLFR